MKDVLLTISVIVPIALIELLLSFLKKKLLQKARSMTAES